MKVLQKNKMNQESIANSETLDDFEVLRQILSHEQHREITYDEASDIGESLIEFFKLLAGVVKNDSYK